MSNETRADYADYCPICGQVAGEPLVYSSRRALPCEDCAEEAEPEATCQQPCDPATGCSTFYLVLCETAHGTRYWRTTTDPQLESDRVKWFGPATVGPEGYPSEAEAAEALADYEAEIDLEDPNSWWEVEKEEDEC